MNPLIRSVELKLARAASQADALLKGASAWSGNYPFPSESLRSELLPNRCGFRIIWDKHRIPSLALLKPKGMDYSFTVSFTDDEKAACFNPSDTEIWAGPLFAGVVIIEHKCEHPLVTLKGECSFKAKLQFQCDDNFYDLDWIVPSLYNYTSKVAKEFGPFF